MSNNASVTTMIKDKKSAASVVNIILIVLSIIFIIASIIVAVLFEAMENNYPAEYSALIETMAISNDADDFGVLNICLVVGMIFYISLYWNFLSIWKKDKPRLNADGKRIITCSYLYLNQWYFTGLILMLLPLCRWPQISSPVCLAILLFIVIENVLSVGSATLEKYALTTHTITQKKSASKIVNDSIRTTYWIYLENSTYYTVTNELYQKASEGKEYYFLNEKHGRKNLTDIFDTESWAVPTEEEDKVITAKMKKTYLKRMLIILGILVVYWVLMLVVIPFAV